MREGAKQRLAGAVVIVALVVIFVPMLIEQRPPPPPALPLDLPSEPTFAPRFESESYLTPETSGIGGLDEERISEPLPLPQPEAERPGVIGMPSAPPPREAVSRTPTAPLVDAPQESSAPPPMPRVTPAPAPKPKALGSWVVQVASLGAAGSAAELEADLRAKGYAAFVEEAEVSGKRFYRVRVGPMIERAEAERAAERLRDGQGLNPLIQRYP
ncbi:MAG: SPOR domain-containing protein [Chromatiaceae bacterium]|nr:SPOR domain-containing protein [Chromatiaceae bacterium]